MGDHDFGPAGGEVALDTEGNVLLYVPENTFKRPTSVTWSLTEGVPGCPVVDIVARELGRDFEPEVKLFEKYVQIIYKNVPVTSGQTGSVTVEGCPDFPTLRVPRQNFEQPEIADSKPEVDDSTPETPKSKPEIDESKTEAPDSKLGIALSQAKSAKVDLTEDVVDEGLESKKTTYARGAGVLFTDGNLLSSQSEQLEYSQAERELEGKPETDPIAEVESIFHTFYTFRDAATLVIYTKHFSRFTPDFRCPDHQGEFESPFDSNITAAIFRSREPVKVKDEYHMSVKVVLQIEDGSVPIGQPNHYDNPSRINDHKLYTYMNTVTLSTPPNSTLIRPGSKFDVRVKVIGGETEEWTFNKEFSNVQKYLENCIPCRECFQETLPDSAVLKFIWKPPDDMGACVDLRTKADDFGAGVDMRNVTARPRDFSFKMELEIFPLKGKFAAFLSSDEFLTCELVDIAVDTSMVGVQQEDLNRVQSNLSSNNNANSPTGVSTAVTTEGSSSSSFMLLTDGDIDLLSRRMGNASINQGQPSGLPRSGNLPLGVDTRTPSRARTTTDGSTGQAAGSGTENLTLDVGTSTPARRRTTTDGATSNPLLGQMSPLSPDQPSVTSGDDGYRSGPADSNMEYNDELDSEGLLPSNEAVDPGPIPKLLDVLDVLDVQPHPEDQQSVNELTPEHLSELSQRLTTRNKVDTLGTRLGVEYHHIDAAFSDNNGDIKSAAKEVLKTWRSRFASATNAYAVLWWALDKAGLIQDAAIILKHRPPCQITSDNPPP